MESNTRAARSERWRRLVVEHACSGLSLRAFAARHGVSANTLAYWKYTRRIGAKPARLSIVPVRVVDDASVVRAELVIEFSDARLRILPGFDAELLSRVVEVLRRPC